MVPPNEHQMKLTIFQMPFQRLCKVVYICNVQCTHLGAPISCKFYLGNHSLKACVVKTKRIEECVHD